MRLYKPHTGDGPGGCMPAHAAHPLATPLRAALLVALQLAATPGESTAEHAARLRYYYPVPAAQPPQRIDCEVCVYGGTAGGVAAAVQSARMGRSTVLVEFGTHVGGLSSGGLSDTDG